MIKYIVYKLTRNDDKIYIGITNTKCFKTRMHGHKNSKRFKNYTFEIEIIHESYNEKEINKMEEYYIKIFDSFHNGLNKSIDGKGNHHAPNFNTKGFKFSDKSKKKMSNSAKNRIKKLGIPFKDKKHSRETKENMSKKRKGIIYTPTKLNYDIVKKIRDVFKTKPNVENVGKIMSNGKKMTYERAFSNKFHKKYGITSTSLYNVITWRTWNGTAVFRK